MGAVGETERHRTLGHLLRACDVVYGSSSTLMGAVATWQLTCGAAPVSLVVALWLVPVFNLTWSFVTRHHDRVRADLVRAAVMLPLASFIYVASPTGMMRQLWLPSLMLSVAVGMATGIGTRRASAGFAIALTYAGGLVVASELATHSVDAVVLGDALGLCLTGAILSLVAAQLGRTLDLVTQQRDEATEQRARAEDTLVQLTVAIDKLHREMERRAEVEAELLQAQKLESVGRLAAGIAHEINTPVQFVGDSLSFVRSAVGDLFELVRNADAPGHAAAAEAADLPFLAREVPNALERAHDGLARVTTIIRSMKAFAHPDGAAMEPIDLNRGIEATLMVARNEYKYVADLVTDLEPLPPVLCYGSEINQAVLNIVVNAAHAIEDVVGDTGAHGTLRVATHRLGNEIEIEIGDTGPGIPEAHRARIFDPFFTTKEIGRGSGQGLAIARRVVEKHHGKLTFDTELGRGTTFHIRLPIGGDSPEMPDVALQGAATL
jgi:signal transduction histidine kinase